MPVAKPQESRASHAGNDVAHYFSEDLGTH